jgi:isatin hydrolase
MIPGYRLLNLSLPLGEDLPCSWPGACLGVDTPSVGAAEDARPAHVAGLAHGVVFVEGLANLSELPVRGGLFAFLPLAIRGGSGAPGRAVCLVEEA